MSIQVSCPVFRCPKNSIKRCEGYGRACERYICRTHIEGTLCDRCAAARLEDMKSNYKEMMKDLSRKSFSAAFKGGVVALLIISIVLLAVVVVRWFMKGDQGFGALSVVALLGGGFGIIITLVWFSHNASEYMRAESLELDRKYPGFYDFYQKWQKVVDDATSYSDL